MAVAILHSDQQQLNRSVGNAILYENQTPYLTNTQIAAATGTADLKANVDSYVGHAEQEGLKPAIKRALQIGHDDTSLSDTNVQAATNAATLAANTLADPSKVGPCDLL